MHEGISKKIRAIVDCPVVLTNKYVKSTTDPSSLIILWMLCLVSTALTFCTLRSICIFFILGNLVLTTGLKT